MRLRDRESAVTFQGRTDLERLVDVLARQLVEHEAFARDNIDVALLGEPVNGIAERSA